MSRLHEAVERQGLTTLVMLGVAVGLAVIVGDRAARGAFIIGGSLVAGGLARTVASERHAGMLVNRGRMTDAITLTAIGLAIIVIAASLHRTYADL